MAHMPVIDKLFAHVFAHISTNLILLTISGPCICTQKGPQYMYVEVIDYWPGHSSFTRLLWLP